MSSPGAGLHSGPASPSPAVPAFTVEVDVRGGMLIYHEAHRSTDVACSFDGDPRIATRTLSGWWYPAERRAEKMTLDEQRATLRRIADYCRHNHGMSRLELGQE